jgi:hypothetical protein
VEVVVWVLAFGGWPAIMVTAMFLTGDLERPERVNAWLEERRWRSYERERLAAETVPAGEEETTGVLLFGEGLDPGTPDLALTGGRWWRLGLRDSPTMLVVEQSDFVFEPHWCVYEVDGLQPRLVAAIPRSTARVIHDVVGDEAIVPRSRWDPRQGAIHYPWKPVPAYVDRSFSATASWVGRQEVGAWL